MPLMSGAVPQFSSCCAPLVQFDSCAFCSLTRPPRFSFCELSSTADLLLQAAGVVGDGALQHGGQIEHQRHRKQDRHDACGDPDFALAAAEGGDPFGDPAACEREEQQRQGGANRERQRQRDRAQPDGAGGACDDDRGEHWSRARHVEHAEREAESETVAAAAELLLRKLGERLLEQRFEAREDQAERRSPPARRARPSGRRPAAGAAATATPNPAG